MKAVVSDAAPLIFLAKLALLDTLSAHLEIWAPREVAEEATQRQDLPDAVYLKRLIDEKRIVVKSQDAKAVRLFQKQWGLGPGESAALLLAQSEKVSLLTDDYAAMRVAKALRVPFVATPFLIVQMERQGWLERALARTKLDRLGELAWLEPDVLAAARRLLEGGEL